MRLGIIGYYALQTYITLYDFLINILIRLEHRGIG